MKTAFQKDEALLTDMRRARDERRRRLWWLGQSGFLLHAPEATILFDPYLSDSLTRKYATTDKPHVRIIEQVVAPEWLTGIDLISSSHNHTDHLDAETLLPLFRANPSAHFLLPRANREFASQRLGEFNNPIIEMSAGEQITSGSVTIHGITAAHNTVERDDHGDCRFMGFVVAVGGLTVYHSGDTLLHEGLADSLSALKPDVAIVPINGNKPERRVAGNLNGREAAGLANEIDARLAIPHHFDMFEFNTASPDEFEAECRRLGQDFRTLRNGEGVDL